MDFRQNSQVPSSRNDTQTQPAVTGGSHVSNFKDVVKGGRHSWALITILKVVVLVGAALLLLTTTFAVMRGGNTANEASQVDKSKYQALFLSNGQVYFGKAKEVNSRYITLEDVFYLTQSTTGSTNAATAASGDYTLVKLGCQQIHYPEDQMVVTRSQVSFWENLNKDGKVAKSISDYKKQYPNGANCSEQTSQTPAPNTPSQSTSGAGSTTQTTQQPTTTNNSGN